MALEHLDGLELPAAADMHVHLRDGAMTELVAYAILDDWRLQSHAKLKLGGPFAMEE